MERRIALANRSNSDSSDSFSFSSLSSKFSQRSTADSYMKSNSPKPDSASAFTFKNKMPNISLIQNRRTPASSDNLSVTLHTSETDYKRRRARAGFSRQKSVSRWMADTVSEQVGKIKRSLSSHESLLSISSLRKTEPEMSNRKNAAFRLFPARVDSNMSLPKPVRKRSSGPDTLLKDVLSALAGTVLDDEDSDHPEPVGKGMRNKIFPFMRPDEGDIEEEDTDPEDEEHHVIDFTTDDKTETEPSSKSSLFESKPAPLLGARWCASSPTRQMTEKKDTSPTNALVSQTRCSSKTMPVPPPPPFSPVKRKAALNVVPDGLFQPFSESNPVECDKMGESRNSSNVAPLAAAIAIATDSMGSEQQYEDEEGLLNDLVEEASHSYAGTDEATAGSANWNDSDISANISLLSASNATLHPWVLHSSTSMSLGALNEQDSLEDHEEEVPPRKSKKDFSYKSTTEDTLESGVSFHHDSQMTPVASKSHVTPVATKNSVTAQMRCAMERRHLLTPHRDASVVPPCMPMRSVSNHGLNESANNLDGFGIPEKSPRTPSDRVQRLLDANNPERKYRSGRRSSLSNSEHNCGRRNATFRRSSLDSSLHSSSPMTPRNAELRRASLDSNAASPFSGMSMPRLNPYDPGLTPEARELRLQYLKQSFVTPRMSKTSRTSPAIGCCRKSMGETRSPGKRIVLPAAPPLNQSPRIEEEDWTNKSCSSLQSQSAH